PIGNLLPFTRNSRTHSEAQVAQVAASIIEFRWTNPVLVGADGVIIAGHARVLAARKLGLAEVPVIVLGHLSETQRRALVIADNKLALNAGWDEEILREEMQAAGAAGGAGHPRRRHLVDRPAPADLRRLPRPGSGAGGAERRCRERGHHLAA